jgi:hypothetical protein
MKIVDFHTHLFPPGVIRNRERYLDDPNFRSLYGQESARMADHDALLRAMDEGEVSSAVIMGFPWKKKEHCLEHNDYLLEAERLSHRRLVPFGTLPEGGPASVESTIEGLHLAGFPGVGEIAFYGSGLTDQALSWLREVCAAALDRAMMVCLHVNEPLGHMYPGKYRTDFALLFELIRDFPGLTFILSHWGGGMFFYELMPEGRAALANTYYDTAASPFIYDDRIYGAGALAAGASKILFGSDFPLLDLGRCISPIINAPLPEEDKADILGGNARRLFRTMGRTLTD